MLKAYQYKKAPLAKQGWMGVLDKMVAQDLTITLISVWSVIVAIIVSREFIRVLNKAVQGEVPSDVLAVLLGLKTVTIGVSLLPPAGFMAVLMVLGRMYRDQEMSAIFAAGGGLRWLYRAVLIVILPVTLFSAWCAFYAAPWAEAKTEKIFAQGKQNADLRGIAAGKFSDYSQGELVFYVESISPDHTLHKVFVEQRTPGNQSVISAESAQLRDLPEGRYIVFANGQRTQGEAGRLDYTIEQFRDYAVRIADESVVYDTTRLALMTSKALWNSQDPRHIAEWQRRLSIPTGLLLLSLIGVPLAQMTPRGGVYGNILTGFLIYFSYGNFVRISQVSIANGTLPGWIGALSINSGLLIIAGILLVRFYGGRWLLSKTKDKVSA